jgi:hypothetical protein
MTAPAPVVNEIVERRHNNNTELLELVKIIHANQIVMDKRLTEHMKNETMELAEAITKLMGEAFPGGDVYGHKQAHVAWIEEVKERTDFYRTMKKKLVEWGLLGFAGWAVFALWQAFLQGPHK